MMKVVEVVADDLAMVVVVVVGKPAVADGLAPPPTEKRATNPRISTAAAIPSRVRDRRTIYILHPGPPSE